MTDHSPPVDHVAWLKEWVKQAKDDIGPSEVSFRMERLFDDHDRLKAEVERLRKHLALKNDEVFSGAAALAKAEAQRDALAAALDGAADGLADAAATLDFLNLGAAERIKAYETDARAALASLGES